MFEISKIIRLALVMVHGGIIDTKRASYDRVVESLGSLSYVTEKIEKDDKEVSIELRLIEDESFYRLLAGEANRFILASRVSYQRSSQEQDRNASWQAIELYYSAYFSIHYLIRCVGWGVTNIDKKAVQYIERSFESRSGSACDNTPSGLYTFEYDPDRKVLSLKKNLKKSGGGSHKEAWAMWVKLIDKLNALTESDIDEYAHEAVTLQHHYRFVVQSDSKFRPPEIRGFINYQFSGKVWEFEKGASDSVRVLQSLLSEGSSFNVSSGKEVEKLLSNSRFIIELAGAMFLHICSLNKNGISNKLKHQYQHLI